MRKTIKFIKGVMFYFKFGKWMELTDEKNTIIEMLNVAIENSIAIKLTYRHLNDSPDIVKEAPRVYYPVSMHVNKNQEPYFKGWCERDKTWTTLNVSGILVSQMLPRHFDIEHIKRAYVNDPDSLQITKFLKQQGARR